MNNKELVSELSRRLEIPQSRVSRLLDVSTCSIVQSVKQGDTVQMYGFGSFGLRKKEDRILVNPATRRQMIVPPKLTMVFKTGSTYKEKIRNTPQKQANDSVQ